jgi:Mrp family chromosome partitioning ATPase
MAGGLKVDMNIIEKAIKLREAEVAPEARRPAASARRRGASIRPGPASGEPARFMRLAEMAMLPEPERDQDLIEQLRHLKRPILQNAFGPLSDNALNLVMVTSARPGAGKSYTSAGLAWALTRERELSVVIVDLDNIKATLTRGLDLADRRGFFDAVDQDDASLESVLVATEIPGLRILPTGAQNPDSAELLNSERARQLVRRLADDDPTRIIILDTPPLLSTADAHAILDLAHQVVLVVETGVTKQSEMRQILANLKGEKPVGIVLNKAISGLAPLYGGDYYGGGYDRA